MTPDSLILKLSLIVICSTESHVISAVVQRSLSSSCGTQTLQERKGALLKGKPGLRRNGYLRWHLYTRLHTHTFKHTPKLLLYRTWPQTTHTTVTHMYTEPGVQLQRHIASTHSLSDTAALFKQLCCASEPTRNITSTDTGSSKG